MPGEIPDAPREEMPTQSAGVVTLTVVAARKDGEWIIRGFQCFGKPDSVRASIEQFVGKLDSSITWTTCQYPLPAYLVYGNKFDGGDLEGWGWPSGIWKFPCSNPTGRGDIFRGKTECLQRHV